MPPWKLLTHPPGACLGSNLESMTQAMVTSSNAKSDNARIVVSDNVALFTVHTMLLNIEKKTELL